MLIPNVFDEIERSICKGKSVEVSVWAHIFAAGTENISFRALLLECLLFTKRRYESYYGVDCLSEVTYRNIDSFKIQNWQLNSFVAWFQSERCILQEIHPTMVVEGGIVKGLQRQRLCQHHKAYLHTYLCNIGCDWECFNAPMVKISKDITTDAFKDILRALSDETNTLGMLDRCEGGIEFTKYGEEIQGVDYIEIFMRFGKGEISRDPCVYLQKDTTFYFQLEQFGGRKRISEDEIMTISARFSYMAGATVLKSKGYRELQKRMKHYAGCNIHRQLVWLLLHRHGVYETDLMKKIMRSAELV